MTAVALLAFAAGLGLGGIGMLYAASHTDHQRRARIRELRDQLALSREQCACRGQFITNVLPLRRDTR